MIQPDPTSQGQKLSLLPGESLAERRAPSMERRSMLEAVRELYRSEPVVRMILNHAASRLRNQVATRVDRLVAILHHEGHQIFREDLLAAFASLENLSIGRIVRGRTAMDTRFVWNIGLMDLGRQIAVPSMDRGHSLTSPRGPRDGLINHTFHLRADVPVNFRLPLDLSQAEVARLNAYLRTLPLDGSDGS